MKLLLQQELKHSRRNKMNKKLLKKRRKRLSRKNMQLRKQRLQLKLLPKKLNMQKQLRRLKNDYLLMLLKLTLRDRQLKRGL